MGETRSELRELIQKWKNADDAIKGGGLDNEEQVDVDESSRYKGMTQEQRVREQRKHLAEQIFDLLERHPGFADEAERFGFTHKQFDPGRYEKGERYNPLKPGGGTPTPGPSPTPYRDETATGTQGPPSGQTGAVKDHSGQGGGGGSQGTGTQGPPSGGKDEEEDDGGDGGQGAGHGGGTGHGHGGGSNADRLPGKLGKDYEVRTGPGGQVYVVYKSGKERDSWTVPQDLLDHYGISKRDAKPATKADIKRWNHFGDITQVKLQSDRHPYDSWVEEMADRFGIAKGLIKDPQVMRVFRQAHFEKWDAQRLLGRLEQTDYYTERTQAEIEWATRTNEAQKKAMVAGVETRLMEHMQNEFGGVNWREHFSQDELNGIALKVAKGSIGWDEASALHFITKKARQIEGSTAWVNFQQETHAYTNAFEDKFAQLRDDSFNWLGPNAALDKDTLRQRARNLVAGIDSQPDWDKYLREQRAAMHPYITDPNTKWTDFASPYRASIERILGQPTNWDDSLLSDLSAVKNDGTRDRATAMSLYDFEDFVRHSDRFRYSQAGVESADKLLSVLDSTFNGRG